MSNQLNMETEVSDEVLNEFLKSTETVVRESYLLNNWYWYKRNVTKLVGINLKNARLLFKSLKELSTEERDFLAEKYDNPTIINGRAKKPNDEMVAEELGMTKNQYALKRREVQKKLKRIMEEQLYKEHHI